MQGVSFGGADSSAARLESQLTPDQQYRIDVSEMG